MLAALGGLHLLALAATFFLEAPQLEASLGQRVAFTLFLAFLLLSEIAFLSLLNGALERAFRRWPRKGLLDFSKAVVLGLALAATSLSLFKLLTVRSHLRFSDLWFTFSNARQLAGESQGKELILVLALLVGIPGIVALAFAGLRRLRRNPLANQGTVGSFGLLFLLGVLGAGGSALRYESVPAFARHLVPEIHWLDRWTGSPSEELAEGSGKIPQQAWGPRPMTRWEPGLGLGNAGTAETPAAEGLPNVVLIMLESVPWTRLGIGGGRREATPNLDRLAEEALVFSRAYTPSVHSDYAQMAILSSLYPRKYDRHDYYTDLSYPRTLIWDLLAPAGWQTSMFSCQNEGWGNMLAYLKTPGIQTLRHSPDWPEAPRRGRGQRVQSLRRYGGGGLAGLAFRQRPRAVFHLFELPGDAFPVHHSGRGAGALYALGAGLSRELLSISGRQDPGDVGIVSTTPWPTWTATLGK